MKPFWKKNFVWTEPWFFCQRIRDRGDWFRALIPAVLGTIAVAVLVFVAQGNKMGLACIPIGLMAGAAIQLAIEAPFLRRDAWIDDKAIEVFGNAGQFTSFTSIPLHTITSAELRRPEEIRLPFSMLVIQMNNAGSLIGIPQTIRLEQLASTLHRLKVPVILSGWEPPTSETDPQNEYVYHSPADQTPEAAKIESIPESERNLTPMPNMLLALFMAIWPFLIWMALMGWVGYLVYQNWNGLSFWLKACGAIASFASLTIPFKYYEIVGEFLSAHYLIGVAQNRIRQRVGALITTFDERTIPVEQIKRETFAAMAPKVIDFGMLTVDAPRQRLLYEGNLERLILPFSSIISCRVEEVQYGTAGESATGQLRCFVVLTFQKESGPYEIGLRVADKELGKETDNRRMRKAAELYVYLIDSVTMAD